MIMKESRITAAILRYLNSLPNAYFFKEYGSAYHSSEPDIIGCWHGQAVVIEVKRPGEHSRLSQRAVQRKWHDAGAVVLADVTSVDDVREALYEIWR